MRPSVYATHPLPARAQAPLEHSSRPPKVQSPVSVRLLTLHVRRAPRIAAIRKVRRTELSPHSLRPLQHCTRSTVTRARSATSQHTTSCGGCAWYCSTLVAGCSAVCSCGLSLLVVQSEEVLYVARVLWRGEVQSGGGLYLFWQLAVVLSLHHERDVDDHTLERLEE